MEHVFFNQIQHSNMWTRTYFRYSSLGWERSFSGETQGQGNRIFPPRSSPWSGRYLVHHIPVIHLLTPTAIKHPSPPITECQRTSHITSHSEWNMRYWLRFLQCSSVLLTPREKKKKPWTLWIPRLAPLLSLHSFAIIHLRPKTRFLVQYHSQIHCPSGRCLRFTNLFTKRILQVYLTSFSLPFWPVSSYLNQNSPQPGNPPSSVLMKETRPWPHSILKSFHKIIPSREA